MGKVEHNLRGISGEGGFSAPKVTLEHLRHPVECLIGGRSESGSYLFKELQAAHELKACYELRYQVYCKERGFLPVEDYMERRAESDCHDHGNCLHFGGVKSDGSMAGTNRLIVSNSLQLPLRARCEITDKDILKAARGQRVAEISRLAVSRNERKGGSAELVMGLYKIMYQSSKLNDVQYWFAAMERSLVRLLDRLHFHFEPIGPVSDYYGEVQPYVARIADIERAVKQHNPRLFAEFSRELDDQRSWTEDDVAQHA